MPFDVVQAAKTLGFLLLMITKRATRFDENMDIQLFLKDCRKLGGDSIKVVAYNTGKLGRLSKLLNKFMTITDPIVTPNLSEVKNIHYHNLGYHDYAAKVSDKLSSRELNKSLFSSFMLPILTFYVIGQHVEKSLSPEIHNAAYNALGLPHRCVIYQCLSVDDIRAVMKRPDFGGACVIMPFKLQVLDLVDDVSEHVSRIGALNTMYAVRSPENREKVVCYKGDNTDWIGIRNVIVSCSSPINGANDSRTALVLGAGGMARASLYALISTGVKTIYLYNRTISKAQDLAKHFNDQSPLTFGQPFPKSVDFNITVVSDILSVPDIDDFVYPSIIVNCIPSIDITSGKGLDFDLPDFWFESASGGVFVDIGYEPFLSPSLIKARKHGNRGWIATNGLSYLHAQAISQFEMHTGKIAPSELMKNTLMNSFAAYN
jgi:shikimate 5-dehydrogenase